jgi:predicted transcriptional regulator
MIRATLSGLSGSLPWIAKEYTVVHRSRMQGSESDMNKTAPVSVRLDAGLNERVTAVARALDRPKSWVIEQAVQDFVAMQEWQLAAIDEGLRAADAGRVVAHEDVVAWVQSWGSPDELPMPKCG